jgi:hypothetical protein
MKSLCSSCKRDTNHKVLFDKKVMLKEGDVWWEEHNYQVIECQGCDTLSFRKLYTDAQMQAWADVDFESTSQELYPYRSKFSMPIKSLINTPLNVKAIYKETIESFNGNQHILCGAGLRSIIEAICKDKKIVSGGVMDKSGKPKVSKNLDGKIQGLMEKGFITEESASALHTLRFLGNDAVHEVEAPSSEELRIAIGIVEASIESIYEMRHKATALKEQFARRKNPGKP